MSNYSEEIAIALAGIVGNVVTYYTTKRNERKKAERETEAIRLTNEREDEKYKGEILASQQQLFSTVQKLQNDLIEFNHKQLGQEKEIAKLRAENILLTAQLEKITNENVKLRNKLDKVVKEHKELMERYQKVEFENTKLKQQNNNES